MYPVKSPLLTPKPAGHDFQFISSRRPVLAWDRLSLVESEIDYTKHSEPELVDMFGRMDPRYAPSECARLAKYLAHLGYIVTEGGTGPGSAVPSPAKLQTLVGSSQPIEWIVDFGTATRSFGLGPAQNSFGFVGSGTMQTDGISLWLSGRVPSRRPSASLVEENTQLSCRQIANVESEERLVRFGYNVDEEEDQSICLWLPDKPAADKLVAILPKRRTKEFRPQIKADTQFAARLIAQSPTVPVTVALVVINVLVFVATLAAGAEWLTPVGRVQIAWGSNFGPYTADGEWWRLLTSLFIHFGIAHLVLNMIALATVGPLVERLYGSVNYLVIYVLAGIAGGLASISWQPDINSAGASGAIFGVLGALLAAQLRAGDTFPVDILRPLQNSTLLFLGLSLYAGFRYKGIDNAAHLGGAAAGFLIGLAAARPITGESSFSRKDLRRLARLCPVAAVVLAGGFWFAQRASASMMGEGLYRRTAHWIEVREPAINRQFNAALSLDANGKGNHTALIDTLEALVIPFWREAGDRLGTIELSNKSPDRSTLDVLQDLTDGRADAFQLLDDGLRKNDPEAIAKARQNLGRLQQAALPIRSK
jgi:rhomboid protease GluP